MTLFRKLMLLFILFLWLRTVKMDKIIYLIVDFYSVNPTFFFLMWWFYLMIDRTLKWYHIHVIGMLVSRFPQSPLNWRGRKGHIEFNQKSKRHSNHVTKLHISCMIIQWWGFYFCHLWNFSFSCQSNYYYLE